MTRIIRNATPAEPQQIPARDPQPQHAETLAAIAKKAREIVNLTRGPARRRAVEIVELAELKGGH